jgi:hypothetical protein
MNTCPAADALLFIDLRDLDRNKFLASNSRFKEKMTVRLFNITVDVSRMPCDSRQID